jgi:hypothetical protein
MPDVKYVVLRENFATSQWEPVGPGTVVALSPERAVRQVTGSQPGTEVFGTYVGIPADEFAQFIEGRPRTVVSAHIETLENPNA